MVKQPEASAPKRKSAVPPPKKKTLGFKRKVAQQNNEQTNLSRNTNATASEMPRDWWKMTGPQLNKEGNQAAKESYELACLQVEQIIARLLSEDKVPTEVDVQCELFPEAVEKLKQAGQKCRKGHFGKGSAMYHFIRSRVKSCAVGIMKDSPRAKRQHLERLTREKGLKQALPKAQPSKIQPMTNFHPVQDEAAITGLNAFLKFVSQDLSGQQVPEFFKPFFEKAEVQEKLLREDRFILCFGLGSNQKPVLDFGFVRKQDMDEFRRNYLRRTGTRYDMMFDKLFRLSPDARDMPSPQQLQVLSKPVHFPDDSSSLDKPLLKSLDNSASLRSAAPINSHPESSESPTFKAVAPQGYTEFEHDLFTRKVLHNGSQGDRNSDSTIGKLFVPRPRRTCNQNPSNKPRTTPKD